MVLDLILKDAEVYLVNRKMPKDVLVDLHKLTNAIYCLGAHVGKMAVLGWCILSLHFHLNLNFLKGTPVDDSCISTFSYGL